jgi:pimeloyl-ACP methyl ester carboxylesterase
MAKLQLNGASLDYAEQGQGEPLVLVHGSASDARTWQGVDSELARRFRVVTYSRRYHWPNAPIADGSDYSMAEHVDDLQALIRSLGIAPVHLVGHSYGAFVALLLAIREPTVLRTLVLAEAPAITLFIDNVPRPLQLLKLLFTRPRTGLALLKLGATGIAPAAAAARRGDARRAGRIVGKAVLGQRAYRRLSASRLEQVDANAIQAEFLGSGFPPLSTDQLRNVRVPTLLVEGSRSPAVFHRLNDALQQCLPDARRVKIDDASHLIHEDNAPAYVAAVEDFVAGRTA